MADIFLSYASEDRERARSLVGELERQGWSVWWDRSMHAGPRFDDEIEKALDAARCVVVLWSAHAIRSDWVRNEANEGLKRGILVPAALDASTPPLAFRHNQTAQLHRWPASPGDLDILLRGIRVVCGAEGGADAGPTQTRPLQRRRKWPIALVIAIVAVAALFLAMKPNAPSGPKSAAPRTAVFSFAVPSSDAGAANLASAIANEVVETMDAMGLPVIARSSIEPLSGTARTARAAELGAEFAVNGDIRRDGANLLVSARIDSLGSSRTLWANSYQGADVNALRRQIATQLTDTLRCASSDPSSPGIGGFGVLRGDPDSLGMLFRACSMVRLGRQDEIRVLLRTLVQRYPDSAALNAMLALMFIGSLGNTPPTARPALISEAKTAASRAMTLDPQLPEAYLALFSVRRVEGAPAPELEGLLVEGLRRTPEHATLNAFYGAFLQTTGRIADAEPYLRRAVVGDPLSAAKPYMLACNLESSKPAESEKVLRDAAVRWPDDRDIWQGRMRLAVFGGVGDIDAVLASTPASISAPDAASCWRAVAAAKSQTDVDSMRRLGAKATTQCFEHHLINGVDATVIAAALGNVDNAFAWAEQIGSSRELSWPSLFLRQAEAMQRDARFMPLMRRLGLFDIWRQSDRWPDFCGLSDLPYDCRAQDSSG
jgi:TolB-like protein